MSRAFWRFATWMAVAAIGALAVALPSTADDAGITSRQANDILLELRKIRELLERQGGVAVAQPQAAAPQGAAVVTGGGYVLGSEDAPVTIVEFTDYQCPFCRQYHSAAFEEIKKSFIDTGKVRYVVRDLPLPMHDHAQEAANAARCAGEQGEFWSYRHLLFVNQQKLQRDDILAYADATKLDVLRFAECIDKKAHQVDVDRDAGEAGKVGISGTPTFVVGKSVREGKMQGTKIIGAQPFATFESKIRELLGSM